MVEATPLAQGLHVSLTQLAAEFGITRETAARRIADAGVRPSGERAGHPVYRLKDVWSVVLGQRTGEDPDKLEPFKRQAHYKAEHLKLQVETEQGELIPRIEVEQESARVMRVQSMFLDTLPDVLERDCGLSAQTVAVLEKRIDRAREDLYKALTEDEAA